MKKDKLKFGGISFGGKKPSVRIYGDTHKLFFGRFKKEKKYGYVVEKKKKRDFFLKYFYLLFPLYDVFIYFSMYPPESVVNATKPVTHGASEISKSLGGFYIPSWGYVILMFLYFFMVYYLLYLLIFRGVRPWHGTEHKVISAAESNDLKNVKSYNPIHERCGGTLLPTMALGYIIFLLLFYFIGLQFGIMTIVTALVFLNVKYFHKYDKIGIWFGKKFQKYFSVKEPEDWQLKLGTEGMRELVKAEQNKKYKAFGIVFDEREIPKKKKNLKVYIPELLILFLTFMVFVSVVYSPPLPTMNYITDGVVTFSGLPDEIKTDYVSVQINTTEETLSIDKIRVWGLFDPIENLTYNDTIYDGLFLQISVNNETKMFINETDSPEKVKYWEMRESNCSILPIDKHVLLNFTFWFVIPENNYNNSNFTYMPVIRFTSFV